MNPLLFLLILFAGFGVFGFWADRRAVQRERDARR